MSFRNQLWLLASLLLPWEYRTSFAKLLPSAWEGEMPLHSGRVEGVLGAVYNPDSAEERTFLSPFNWGQLAWLLSPGKTWRNQTVNSSSSDSKAYALYSTLCCHWSKSEHLILSSQEKPSHFQKTTAICPSSLFPDQCPTTQIVSVPSSVSLTWFQIFASFFSEYVPICPNPLKHARCRSGHRFSDPDWWADQSQAWGDYLPLWCGVEADRSTAQDGFINSADSPQHRAGS